MRKGRIFLSVLLVLSLLASGLGGRLPKASAAVAPSISISPLYVPIDATASTGTPFMVYVQISGGAASAQYYYKMRAGIGTALASGITWVNSTGAVTNVWGTDTSGWTSVGVATLDAGGAWSGWVAMKVLSTITSVAGYSPAAVLVRSRIHIGSTNID